MNRDLRKIVLLDDSTVSSQLFPGNTILVKPFTDINGKSDTVLYDLIPVLQAFVHDGCTDFPAAIEDLGRGTHDADELVLEYHMRIANKRQEEQQRRNKGLGGMLRGSAKSIASQVEVSDMSSTRSSILSVSDIVGASPTGGSVESNESSQKKISADVVKPVGFQRPEKASKKKGSLFEYIERENESKEEMMRIKHEKMNEMYFKKMQEKQRQEEEELAKKRKKEQGF